MPSLRQLHFGLQPFAFQLLKLAGHDVRVTSVRRSRAEQARLYERFLAGKSNLPAAPPGQSLHEYGLAFDLARAGIEPHDDPVLAQLGEVWNAWGGHWSRSDPVHFEVRP